jgi:hypothetical protein
MRSCRWIPEVNRESGGDAHHSGHGKQHPYVQI